MLAAAQLLLLTGEQWDLSSASSGSALTCVVIRPGEERHLVQQGDGRLKGRITKTNKTSRHRSLRGKSEYLSLVFYEGDQTWLIYLQSTDGHCSFLQNESSQELKVRAEEQFAEDEFDDSFLNCILISCSQVLWTDMLPGCCSTQDRKALQRVIHPSIHIDSGELRCLHRAQRILKKTSIPRSNS